MEELNGIINLLKEGDDIGVILGLGDLCEILSAAILIDEEEVSFVILQKLKLQQFFVGFNPFLFKLLEG